MYSVLCILVGVVDSVQCVLCILVGVVDSVQCVVYFGRGG